MLIAELDSRSSQHHVALATPVLSIVARGLGVYESDVDTEPRGSGLRANGVQKASQLSAP